MNSQLAFIELSQPGEYICFAGSGQTERIMQEAFRNGI